MVTSGEIAQGLSGLRGTVPTRFVWQRRTLDYQFRDSLSDAGAVLASRAPRLELDNDRSVLRSIRGIELRESALADLPGGLFDPTADSVAVVEQRYILGAWRDFPLGLFRLELGDTRYGTDGEPVVECDAADLGMILTESGPSATYTVASGTDYGTATIAVLNALGLVHDLSMVGLMLPTVQSWPPYPETSWWQVLRDLADGVNYRTPCPNAQGRFVWAPQDVDPSLATEAVVYSDADEPRLIEGDTPYRRRQHAGTLRNRVVVLIDDPLHPDFPTRVVRENADPASPISTANRPEPRHGSRPSMRYSCRVRQRRSRRHRHAVAAQRAAERRLQRLRIRDAAPGVDAGRFERPDLAARQAAFPQPGAPRRVQRQVDPPAKEAVVQLGGLCLRAREQQEVLPLGRVERRVGDEQRVHRAGDRQPRRVEVRGGADVGRERVEPAAGQRVVADHRGLALQQPRPQGAQRLLVAEQRDEPQLAFVRRVGIDCRHESRTADVSRAHAHSSMRLAMPSRSSPSRSWSSADFAAVSPSIGRL